jgi:hypothetical protein
LYKRTYDAFKTWYQQTKLALLGLFFVIRQEPEHERIEPEIKTPEIKTLPARPITKQNASDPWHDPSSVPHWIVLEPMNRVLNDYPGSF